MKSNGSDDYYAVMRMKSNVYYMDDARLINMAAVKKTELLYSCNVNVHATTPPGNVIQIYAPD